MKTKLAAILMFLSSPFVQSQSFQIDKPTLSFDSLQKALPLLHDSARIDCLNELARSVIEGGSFRSADSSLAFAKQAYKEASAINYIKGLGDACIRYGIVDQWYHWDFHSMENDYRESIRWYKKIQNDNGLGYAFRGLGEAFLRQNLPGDAEKAFQESSIYFRKTHNRVMLADLTDQSGLVYGAKGDFERQFEYMKKGLREKISIDDKRGIVWSFYRLAFIYQSAGDYETTLNYFRQSFQQAQSQSIPWRIYNSMGTIFFNLKNYDSAFYYYQKMYAINPGLANALIGMGRISLLQNKHRNALQFFQDALIIFKKTGNLQGKTTVCAEIGNTYAEMKQYTTALQYARESLAIAAQINAKDILQNAYEICWTAFEALQQKDSTYFYYRKFVTLKDSLDNARFKRQHLQKLALYTVEAKEEQQQARLNILNKDNQLKQQQLQKEALMRKVLIGSIIGLIVLGTIILRAIILKRANEKHRRELAENALHIQELESERAKAELQQQAAELEMQALRSQMNPHFIFNCLNSINHFVLKNETESASDYLTKFSRLIRMVLHNSKHKYITLDEELDCLDLYIQMEQLRFKNAFRYQIKCDAGIDGEDIMVPPLLIQPFAENAIWHGLMHKEDGEARLDILLELKEGVIECIVTDNGVGRKAASKSVNKSASKHNPMGLQITKDRIALLGGNREECFINIEDLYDDNGNATGTKVTLKIRCDRAGKVFEISGV